MSHAKPRRRKKDFFTTKSRRKANVLSQETATVLQSSGEA